VSKSRVVITAGAVFLSAALAVVSLKGSTAEPMVKAEQAPIQTSAPIPAEVRSNPVEVANKPDQIWTYNCEFPEQRPETILLTCADGGWMVTEIKWNSWTLNGASGLGIYSENQCDPDCATGERIDSKVKVRLSNPIIHKGRNILQTLDIEPNNGSQLPGDRTSLSWNVAEFAIRMNWVSSLP
jgi:hypothetical protein